MWMWTGSEKIQYLDAVCEYEIEAQGSIKEGEILDQMNDFCSMTLVPIMIKLNQK